MPTGSETSPFAIPSMPFVAGGQKLFNAAAQLQAQSYRALMRYQIEMLGFLKHRCEQDVKLVDDLVASDQFNDAFDVVSNFMQNAASEYTAEAGKFAAIGGRLASETAKRVRKEADKVIEDAAASSVA